MAASQRVAYRYAKAIIDLAQEREILDVVKNDLSLIEEVSVDNRDFLLMLKSPLIKGNKKLSIFNEVFKDKINNLTSDFFSLAISKGREADLLSIIESYMSQYNTINGITIATVKSAISLDSSSKEVIKELVAKASGNSKIIIQEQIDVNLIGGYVLSVEDKQLDASVKTMLQKAKNQFTK